VVPGLVLVDDPVNGDPVSEQVKQQPVGLEHPVILVGQIHGNNQAAGLETAVVACQSR
jgi:hypothetical protein